MASTDMGMLFEKLKNASISLAESRIEEVKTSSQDLEFKEVRHGRAIRTVANISEVTPAAQAPVVEGSAPIYGVMMYSSEWKNDADAKKGVYSIPTDGKSTNVTEVKLDPSVFTTAAFAVGRPGKYTFARAGISYSVMLSNVLHTFNSYDWAETPTTITADITNRTFVASDAAYDPLTGRVYACMTKYGTTDWGLYRLTLDTKYEAKNIAPLTDSWSAMAFDAQGKLWAITTKGDLLLYDLNNLSYEKKASGLPLSTKYTSGTIDTTSGRFYYAVCNDAESALYEISLTDGKATKLYDFPNGEEFIGFYVPGAKPAGTVPAKAQSLSFKVTNPSLSGNISFIAPDTNADGLAAEGELSYKLYINDKLYKDSITTCGKAETIPFEVQKAGDYTVSIRFSNKSGEGEPMLASTWLGNDIPKAISTVTATYADGKTTVKWSAPYAGVNGGYVNSSKFTYTVVRNFDGKVVAENITARSFEDTMPEVETLTLTTYSVRTNFEGNESAPTVSNTISFGAATPPFFNDCSTDPMAYFTTFDGNKDYKTWSWSSVYKRLHISQSTTADMDDWLFSPAIKLKAGHTYKFSFIAFSGAANYTQKMEVTLGKQPTVEAMTDSIIPAMTFTNVEKDPYAPSIDLQVKEDGIYYIGWHAMSEKSNNYICLKNISIEKGVSLKAPAEIKDLTVAPDMNGLLKAELKFTSPSKTFEGGELKALTKIDIYCNDELVESLKNVTPGQAVTYTHSPEKGGTLKYQVIPYNADGEGQPSTVETFVGYTIPLSPATASAVEISDGVVKFDWASTSLDANGKNLGDLARTYFIMELDQDIMKWLEVAKDLNGNTHTMRLCADDEPQDFRSLGIGCETEYGRSKYRALDLIPVGKSYNLPFCESNVNNSLSYTFMTTKISGDGSVIWRQANNSTISGMIPYDGDNGYFYMDNKVPGEKAALISGKIQIPTDVKNPVVSLAYVGRANCKNKIEIIVRCEGQDKVIKDWETSAPQTEWDLMTVDLPAEYKGKMIQFVITGEIVSHQYNFIDRLELVDYPTVDAAVTSIEAPEYLPVGREGVVECVVANKGKNNVAGYTVQFLADGKVIAEGKNLTEIGFQKSYRFSLPVSVTPMQSDSVVYSARVICPNDAVEGNNEMTAAATIIKENIIPAPTALKAVEGKNPYEVELTWTEPDLTTLTPMVETEDVEDYESFSISNFGDWSVFDNDKKVSNSFSSIDLPHLGKESFAYMVFDNSDRSKFNSTFAAKSGKKYFIAFANQGYLAEDGKTVMPNPNDDWLISPELTGKAQEISFWARAYHPSYPETFEVLASSTDKSIEAFKLVARQENISYEGKTFTFSLPEGTKHFAIRCISENGYMFIVDDITFTRKVPEYTLQGYNLYTDRNEVTKLDKATSYTAKNVAEGTHIYQVTAVYDRGESNASDPVSLLTSGVDSVLEKSVSVTTSTGEIKIAGAVNLPVMVADTNGIVFHRGIGDATVAVNPGIYFVTVQSLRYKVIVK